MSEEAVSDPSFRDAFLARLIGRKLGIKIGYVPYHK